MNELQKQALTIAIKRFGKERVFEEHKKHQYLIDEWKCDLRALNTMSLKEMEDSLNSY